MNKEKWMKIHKEEAIKLGNAVKESNSYFDPIYWPVLKEAELEFIKEMDKAYEVYMMENGKK